MKKNIFTSIFLLCICFLSAQKNISENLSILIPQTYLNNLIKDGKVVTTRYADKDMQHKLIPQTNLAKRVMHENKDSNFSPVFIMEGLYLIKKENGISKDISKILRSVSTLEGLEYYSNSRKKMRLLYKTSHAVEKIENSGGKITYNKIPDPTEGKADGMKILVRQEDLTFGDYIYEYTYFSENSGAGMICTNTSVLKYSVFKAVRPNNLKVSLLAEDLGDYLLVYSCTEANFIKLAGIGKKLSNSFLSRAEAMYSWFIKQYNSHVM